MRGLTHPPPHPQQRGALRRGESEPRRVGAIGPPPQPPDGEEVSSRVPLQEGVVASLVVRYQSGEREALGALYQCLEPAIRSVLRRYRSSELPACVSVQDVSQQSWVILAELAARWRPAGSFLGYFFRSFPLGIRRYVYGAGRRRGVVQMVTMPHDDLVAAMDRAQSVEAVAEDGPFWTEGLADLPPAQRAVFLLHTMENRDFTTISRVLRVSRSSAHRLYHRAVAELARRLDGGSFPGRTTASSMERLVRTLHAAAGPGRVLPGRRRVLAAAGLGRWEYEALMGRLEAAGAVMDRGAGRPGRLAEATAAGTLARVRAR